jgi:hypothetical protein
MLQTSVALASQPTITTSSPTCPEQDRTVTACACIRASGRDRGGGGRAEGMQRDGGRHACVRAPVSAPPRATRAAAVRAGCESVLAHSRVPHPARRAARGSARDAMQWSRDAMRSRTMEEDAMRWSRAHEMLCGGRKRRKDAPPGPASHT